MNNLRDLSQKKLVAILTGNNHETVHKAWQDDTNEGFLICYKITLIFDDQENYILRPCEVDIEGRYPGLGLELEPEIPDGLMSTININNLPQRIDHVIQDDYLGEDVTNQYILVLDNGDKIIIRHVLPPMTMGIRIEGVNA